MTSNPPLLHYLPALLWRWLLALMLWTVLSEGSTTELPFAMGFSLLAALTSLPLLPPAPHHPGIRTLSGLARFIPFFLLQSLLGGFDVARRALHPHMPLAPRLFSYRLRLPPGWPRVLFGATVSLLPGSLATRMNGDRVEIHLLDGRTNPHRALRRVEEKVAAVFGLTLSKDDGEGPR
jgi:multicomponent Na+:H+ antiporter subunit E